MLSARGRIGLTMEISHWLETLGQVNAVTFIPVDNEIAVKSTLLGDKFHKDPADRLIVATCQKLGVPLVTADEKILSYPNIVTIW